MTRECLVEKGIQQMWEGDVNLGGERRKQNRSRDGRKRR